MKKSFLVIFTVLCSSTFVSSQFYPTQMNNDTSLVITFVKTIHNYGTLKQGGDGNCEFKFTNSGKTPLVLNTVKSSCGCTIPEWPKDPILPGDSSSIKVTYDTKRLGQFTKKVTVISNAKNSFVQLTITGNVVTK